MRPDWDSYFIDIAKTISTRSTCSRANVGAVLVDSKHRIVACGYNGAKSGHPHCYHSWCDHHNYAWGQCSNMEKEGFGPCKQSDTKNGHCSKALHAEHNLFTWLPWWRRFFGSYTLYLTHYPCLKCSRERILRYPVSRVVYATEYRKDPVVEELFKLKGVSLQAAHTTRLP